MGTQPQEGCVLFRQLLRLFGGAYLEDYWRDGVWDIEGLNLDIELLEAHTKFSGAVLPFLEDIPEVQLPDPLPPWKEPVQSQLDVFNAKGKAKGADGKSKGPDGKSKGKSKTPDGSRGLKRSFSKAMSPGGDPAEKGKGKAPRVILPPGKGLPMKGKGMQLMAKSKGMPVKGKGLDKGKGKVMMPGKGAEWEWAGKGEQMLGKDSQWQGKGEWTGWSEQGGLKGKGGKIGLSAKASPWSKGGAAAQGLSAKAAPPRPFMGKFARRAVEKVRMSKTTTELFLDADGLD